MTTVVTITILVSVLILKMQTIKKERKTNTHTHTHTPDTRSKPVVRRSLFCGLLYPLGIFKVPQNEIRVDIRIIFCRVFIEA